MTAEVAIINSGAVAIAADSAVTIGRQKIYNSALKVFSLSKIAPVGVMVYGNAGLLDVPWEPLIKSYRDHLNRRRLPTLEDYAKDFLQYIAKHRKFFPAEAKANSVRNMAGGYYALIREELEQSIRKIVKDSGSISAKRTSLEIKRIIDNHHSRLAARSRLKEFGAAFEKQVRKKYVSQFRTAKNEVFENLPISRPYLTKLYDIGCFLCTRDIFSTNTSGLVVAGYGSRDIYPSVLTHEIEGIIDGRMKCKEIPRKSIKITNPNACAILPFAQEDMVDTFVQGWNPAISNFVLPYIAQLLNRLPDLLDDADLSGTKTAKRKLRNKLRRDVDRLFQDFNGQVSSHIQKEHINPILSMVGVLPKDELAAMAESLVNLTAFKRRMTQDIETVGGPIDVAVISKGDGLVWVKRKHYFPPELNQHFFANYFRGIESGRK